MEIPPLWKEILTKVQEIYPEAVIAGGSLRDLDHGKEPKDIDIFVEDLDRRDRTELTRAGFALKDHTTFYFHQGADRVWKTVYKDMPVEIVEMKGSYTPWSVLNRFDFGLNRIAWDGENFYVSGYYKEDKTNRTCTLRSACNKSHYDFLLTEKWEKRLKLKYADLSLVVPDEFKRQYQEEL